MKRSFSDIRLRLARIGDEGSLWELMFLGRVIPATGVTSQHQIEVVFARREGDSNQVGARTTQIQLIRRGVGELPVLKPGTIWCDESQGEAAHRKLLHDHVPSPAEIRTFKLRDPTQAKLVDLCGNEGINIPRETYPLGMNQFAPAFRLFAERGDPAIYIPCGELIRFAFARTDRMSRAMFHLGLDDLLDLSNSRFVPGRNGVAMLRVFRDLRDVECRLLARIVADGRVAKSFRGVHTSIVGADGIGRYPRTSMPFAEPTRIRVMGCAVRKAVPQPGFEDGFFVQRIFSADWPCSFSAIDVEEMLPSEIRRQEGVAGAALIGRQIPSTGELATEAELGPDRWNQSIRYIDEDADPISGPTISIARRRVGLPETKRKGAGRPTPGAKPNAVSAGEHINTDTTVAQAEIISGLVDTDATDSLLNRLWNAAGELEKANCWKIDTALSTEPAKQALRTSRGDVELCLFPIKLDQQRLSWSWIDRRLGLRRRALVVRIDTGHLQFYAIEAERRSSSESVGLLLVVNKNGGEIPPELLNQILAEGSAHKGIWTHSSVLKKNAPLYFRKLHHSKLRKQTNGLTKALDQTIEEIVRNVSG